MLVVDHLLVEREALVVQQVAELVALRAQVVAVVVARGGLDRDLSKRFKTVDDFAKAFCTAVRAEPKRSGFLSSIFGKGKE